MRLAIVGNTLFHQGAEYALAALANAFAGKGDAVDVILSQCQADLQKQHPDWRIFPLHPNVRVLIHPHRRARYSVVSLRLMLKRGGYDVVMCHASPYSPALAMAMFGLRKRPKLIHVVHSGGTGVDGNGNIVSGDTIRIDWCNLKEILAYAYNRWVLRQFDCVCGVSSGTSEGFARVNRYPREKIFTVYNPVIDAFFYDKLKANPAHPWLAENDVPVVVAAGVFMPNKQYLMLIRAFADVLKHRKARLVIFGDGPLRHEYEKEVAALGINDSVSLPGHTDNLPAELKRASCFVVASIVESFSIVCVEALACGVPVVSTNCPFGPPEILNGGEYGIIVENKNQHSLAKGILDVLEGNGIKPMPYMVKPYTVESVVERYENAIAAVSVSGGRS